MIKLIRKAALLVLPLSILSGCTTLWQNVNGNESRKGVSSSLVDFLYPKGEVPPEYDASITNLHLPLKVGLAFVPSKYYAETPGLSETHKAELLAKVQAQFETKKYIQSITVIPEIYLKNATGFDGLSQISRLYDLDVMALVSYDQIVHSDDTKASFFYWTIVGAYVIEGSKNDVQTFVDTAVFDVKTRKLLLRSPGFNRIEANTTLIDSVKDLRKNREVGFNSAMQHMAVNLENELADFKERVKTDDSVKISKSADYGGGSFGLLSLAFLGALFAFRVRHSHSGGLWS